MSDDIRGCATLWYGKQESTDFLLGQVGDILPEVKFTQGFGESVASPAAWLQVLLPYLGWGTAGLVVWNATAKPFLNAFFSELGKSSAKALPQLVKGWADKQTTKRRAEELAQMIRELSAIEGRPTRLVLGVPIGDSGAACGLVIDTTDGDAIPDQVAFFYAVLDGLQALAERLQQELVPYGDVLPIHMNAEGLTVSWFDGLAMKERGLAARWTEDGWIVSDDPNM